MQGLLTDYHLQRKNVQFSDAALEECFEIYQATHAFIKDALDSVEKRIEKAQSLIERHKGNQQYGTRSDPSNNA